MASYDTASTECNLPAAVSKVIVYVKHCSTHYIDTISSKHLSLSLSLSLFTVHYKA